MAAARPAIGRRPELAILETAERLLEERPLAEISVDDLAKGAGMSRPTFYFYFPSKDAVLLTLLERVIAEADAALRRLVETRRSGSATRSGAPVSRLLRCFRHRTSDRPAQGGARRAPTRSAQAVATFMQKWIDQTAA